MQSFELEVLGNRIRILDADGSTYEGTILSAAQSAGSPAGGARFVSPAPLVGRGISREIQTREEPIPETVHFRASGTNNTINQLVSIEAVMGTVTGPDKQAEPGASVATSGLLPTSGLDPMAGAGVQAARSTAEKARRSGVVQPRAADASTPQAANVSIQGNLRIGAAEELTFKALRVAP